MAKLPAVVSAARPYIDAGSLAMFLVYIREAHPVDGWHMPTPDGVCYKQPKTLAERGRVASARSPMQGT